MCAAGSTSPTTFKDGVVVQGVADILELVQKTLEDTPFDRVGRNKIEDQTVEPLAIAVNPTHALFEAIRVLGNVVVEENVAALKVADVVQPFVDFAVGFGFLVGLHEYHPVPV
jgi:hypothetical protein